MRQLAGTIVLFALISCAAATDALDDDATGSGTATLAEITIEGTPEAGEVIDLDARGKALELTKVALAAPYLDVRAVDIESDGGGSTMIEVRTEGGWHRLPDELLQYWEDDPGCPSIERESSIDEIRVEQGALVIVTSSDRGVFEDDGAGTLFTSKARACRESDEGWVCGEPTIVSATAKLESMTDDSAAALEKSYASKYWVNADGEIETERPFEEAVLARAEPGT
jgi:hypothetical protein